MRGLYGAQIPGQLTLKGEWWIAGIIISVAGALLAATTGVVAGLSWAAFNPHRLEVLTDGLGGQSHQQHDCVRDRSYGS